MRAPLVSTAREALLSIYLTGGTPKSLQNFVGQYVADLCVARDSRPTILGSIVPPGVVSAFSEEFATVTAQVKQHVTCKVLRPGEYCVKIYVG
jgi:hypothetical protein